jgi:enoyl-CoA hydratase/carnithine racemase
VPEETTILTELKEGIAQITLNRPECMNAFTWRMGRGSMKPTVDMPKLDPIG